jgi:hypothetical protein
MHSASKRHPIDPKSGMVVHHDRRGLKIPDIVKSLVDLFRKDSRLKAERQ